MRIFSSAENCRRVARRICFTTCSAGSFTGLDFCPICAPSMATMGPKSSLPQPAPFCLIGADAGQSVKRCNSTLAALPGDHLSLTPRDGLQVLGHSARRALTVQFPPRARTLTFRHFIGGLLAYS